MPRLVSTCSLVRIIKFSDYITVYLKLRDYTGKTITK